MGNRMGREGGLTLGQWWREADTSKGEMLE